MNRRTFLASSSAALLAAPGVAGAPKRIAAILTEYWLGSHADVVIGKYLAYLVCTVLLLLPSVVVVFFLAVPLGGGATIAALFPTLPVFRVFLLVVGAGLVVTIVQRLGKIHRALQPPR